MKKMNQSVENAITDLLDITECKVEELKKMPPSLLRDEFLHEVPEGVKLLGQSVEEACKDAGRSLRSFVAMIKESEFPTMFQIAKWQRKNMKDALKECGFLNGLLEANPTAALKNMDRLRATVSKTKEDLRRQCRILQDIFAELVSTTRNVIDEQKKREKYLQTREHTDIEVDDNRVEEDDPMFSPYDEPPSKKLKIRFDIPHDYLRPSTSATLAREDQRYPEDMELPNIGGLSTGSSTKNRNVVACQDIEDANVPLRNLQRAYADEQRFLGHFSDMEAEIFGKGSNQFVECANGADFAEKFKSHGSDVPYLVKKLDDKCQIEVLIGEEPIELDYHRLDQLSLSTTRNTNEIKNFFKKAEAKRKVIDTSMINKLKVDDSNFVRHRSIGAHIKAHDVDFGLMERNRKGFGDVTEKNDLLGSAHSLVLARPSSMSSLQFEQNGSAFYYYVCTGKEVMYVKPATIEDVDLYEKKNVVEKDKWIVPEFGDNFCRMEVSAGHMAVLPTGCLWFSFAQEKTIGIKGNFDTIENFPLAWRIAKLASQNVDKTRRYWTLLFNYVEKFFHDKYEGEEYSRDLGFILFEELSQHLGAHTSYKSSRKRKVLNSLGNRLRKDGYPELPILEAPKRGHTLKVESASGRDMIGADDFMDEH
ncbi:hypothetical protein B9Z55_028496 [Caenorhabditis nigoni]|nr:hypothetical protein B9Z55_028496 [Caenorhabditis nigoni]